MAKSEMKTIAYAEQWYQVINGFFPLYIAEVREALIVDSVI